MSPPVHAPGFRRAIVITPSSGCVSAEVEDDWHHMRVELTHDGETITAITPNMFRWPWSTCPGALDVLANHFVGMSLSRAFAAPGRVLNCTHLYDMAVLAARHANDERATRYDVSVTDPIEGRRELRVWRDGERVCDWSDLDGMLQSPPELAGRTLRELGEPIGAMAADEAEAARILRWGALMASGRQIDRSRQLGEWTREPVCHTYQPENLARATANYDRNIVVGNDFEPLRNAAIE